MFKYKGELEENEGILIKLMSLKNGSGSNIETRHKEAGIDTGRIIRQPFQHSRHNSNFDRTEEKQKSKSTQEIFRR